MPSHVSVAARLALDDILMPPPRQDQITNSVLAAKSHGVSLVDLVLYILTHPWIRDNSIGLSFTKATPQLLSALLEHPAISGTVQN